MENTPAPPGGPAKASPISLGPGWLLFAALALAIPLAALAVHARREPPAQPLPVFSALPDFALVDEAARPFSRKDLLGRAWVVDFIFTSCPDACPRLTAIMKQLQDSLTSEERQGAVGLLSISVDPARDTPAVMQALAWAGLRSSAGPAVAGSLLKHLAAALPAAETSSTAVPASLLGKARDDLTQTLVQAVRETSAMTVIKPSSMDDYDVVMGVPLQDQGQSTPTRLAVAARPAPGGTTTFLRVDTELSHMGRISVRISGLNEGPMAITLLADGGGGRALAEALPDLADSLHQLGLVAGLRVASLSTEDGYG